MAALSVSGGGGGRCVRVLPIRGLIGQLSVEFPIGGDWSWCALASFVAGSVAILGLAWHFGVSL